MKTSEITMEYVTKRVDAIYDLMTRRNFESLYWTNDDAYFEIKTNEEEFGLFEYEKKKYVNNIPGEVIEQNEFYLEDWPSYAALCVVTLSEDGEITANFSGKDGDSQVTARFDN